MAEQLKRRAIIHLDMDAFYPAVEVLDTPELKGKPVIVGGIRGRGVVSSASYEARAYGVHSAQPMITATRLCPHGIFLSPRMSRYKEISNQVFEIFQRFTPLVEPLSIDEAFLDITGSVRLFGQPAEIAKVIRAAVQEETGLTVSAGVAPSKFVAKIASDMGKPDGLTVVPHDQVREFLNPLPIEKMWGVGKTTRRALSQLNVRTFEHLSRLPVETLEKKFGKYGLRMHLLSMGMDDRDVIPDYRAKSVGHEDTFPEDILDLALARKELLALANKVARRMRIHGVAGKTITLKVKYSDFVQVTRSTTFTESTDDGPEIYKTACHLLNKTAFGKKAARLLGISVSQLSQPGSERQRFLFEADKQNRKRKDLHTALDHVQERFGEKSIRPGTLLEE